MGKELLTPGQEGHYRVRPRQGHGDPGGTERETEGLCGDLDERGQEGLWPRQWVVHRDGDAKGAALEGRWRFQAEICCLVCLQNGRVAMPSEKWNILV